MCRCTGWQREHRYPPRSARPFLCCLVVALEVGTRFTNSQMTAWCVQALYGFVSRAMFHAHVEAELKQEIIKVCSL
jgi:hypothetical protein